MGGVKVLRVEDGETLSPYKRQEKQSALEDSLPKEPVYGAAQFPVPVYQVIDGINHIIHSNKPAAITLGHNKDYQTKSQIAMVAGTLGSLVAENDPQTNNPIEVAHPTPTDAASVVVSEMANFRDYNARSVVTVKADVVGIRSGELIELRTGGIPYLANGHQTTNKYGGIHLIAGNKTEGKGFDLQSMVKGENLEEMLRDLLQQVQHLISQVKLLNDDVKNVKKELVDHDHILTLKSFVYGPPLGLPSPIIGVAKITGTTGTSTNMVAGVGPTTPDSAKIGTALNGDEENNTKVKDNFLETKAEKRIKSRFNKVN